MLGPRQQKLVDTLKSGQFKKCCGRLKIGDSYCCLGVATKLAEDDGIKNEGYDRGIMCYNVKNYFKFNNNHGGDKSYTVLPLWEINDSSETFDTVIKAIEQNPELYFSEPV